MRIVLFGGTFDPVHTGHLAMAEAAREALRADRVVFVPCRVSPFKRGAQAAPARDRLAMVRLAVRGNPRFGVSDIELRRPGPSYTFDTVERLRRSMPSKGERIEWFLLLGADALAGLPRWREARRLVTRARVAAVGRAGWPKAALLRALARAFGPRVARGIERRWIDAPRLDIAAQDLRRRVRAGRSVRHLVPDAVERYMRRRGLYRD
jgi:nicotinate-nucleotide adenylyltransferase